LPTDLQIKLLELTRHRKRLDLDELSHETHMAPAMLIASVENLWGGGCISDGTDGLAVNSKQRISIAEKLIHEGRDPEKIARCLEWQEFENFASNSLEENGFRTAKHFVFKTRAGRREVDILAWNDNFLFAVDCKHWAKGLQPSRLRTAVLAQMERTAALAQRPDLLRRIGLPNPEQRSIMPALFTLGEPRLRSIDGVPIVAVSKLVSFLYGISPVDENFLRIPVKDLGMPRLLAEQPKS
jgi:hypothetical protein